MIYIISSPPTPWPGTKVKLIMNLGIKKTFSDWTFLHMKMDVEVQEQWDWPPWVAFALTNMHALLLSSVQRTHLESLIHQQDLLPSIFWPTKLDISLTK